MCLGTPGRLVKVASPRAGWYAPAIERSTPAFVLHTRPYGESDRIVTLLTEHEGKVTGIAKGAKNSRRRFAGTLEPFVHIRAVFRPRETTDLVFLLRCEMLETFRSFTRDLDRFAAGSLVLELTDRMVFGREAGREVYRLLGAALGLLEHGAAHDPLLRGFELHLLALAGYAPSLQRCAGCGTSLLEPATVYLSTGRSSLVCRGCVRPGEPIRPLGGATATLLASLASLPLGTAHTASSQAWSEAAIVTERLLADVTTAPLRSRAFLARTRVDSAGGVG